MAEDELLEFCGVLSLSQFAQMVEHIADEYIVGVGCENVADQCYLHDGRLPPLDPVSEGGLGGVNVDIHIDESMRRRLRREVTTVMMHQTRSRLGPSVRHRLFRDA